MVHCRPPLQIQELPKEDEERLEKLFSKLDLDGNGKIDIHDLSEALKEIAPHINRSYAEVRIQAFRNNYGPCNGSTCRWVASPPTWCVNRSSLTESFQV